MAHSVRCFVVQHCPLVDSMSHDPFDHIGTYFAVPWCGRLKRNSVWLTFSPHYELLFKCCILNVKHVTTHTFFLSLKIMPTPALLCTWLKWISCHPDDCISLLKKKKKSKLSYYRHPGEYLKHQDSNKSSALAFHCTLCVFLFASSDNHFPLIWANWLMHSTAA